VANTIDMVNNKFPDVRIKTSKGTYVIITTVDGLTPEKRQKIDEEESPELSSQIHDISTGDVWVKTTKDWQKIVYSR